MKTEKFMEVKLHKSISGYHGIYPMIYCYFDKSGEIYEEPIRVSVECMIQHNIHGIAVLGLASEVNKLSYKNKFKLLECVIGSNQKRVPLSVTVSENSVSGQIEFAKVAKELGADWFILQPPPVADCPENSLLDFFSNVIENIDSIVAIQNAPQYLGCGLSNAGIKELARRHSNFKLVKTELGSSGIRELYDKIEGSVDIFNGVGGCELPDVLRGGAAGVIPGSESFDVLLNVYNNMRLQKNEEAEKIYREVLPVLHFLDSNIDHLVNYGKILLAKRLGVSGGYPATASINCSKFGLEIIDRFCNHLPKLSFSKL